MKQPINEIKRMQQLAGIINESQLNEGSDKGLRIDLFNPVSHALAYQKEVTVQGKRIYGAFKNNDWSKVYFSFVKGRRPDYNNPEEAVEFGDLENPAEDILINGKPIEIEEKPKSDFDWNDRYGPGGGYDSPAGRYTGD